jgi:protein-disulfide isomerase
MSRKFQTRFVVALITLACLPISTAIAHETNNQQIEGLNAQIKTLQQGQTDLGRQVNEIKALLVSTTKSKATTTSGNRDLKGIPIDIGDNPVMGNAKAKLVMIEYSDYQCPYCARHAVQVLPKIKENFVDTGKIQYAFVDFPLERIHKDAINAARAANCAGEQDNYWDMYSVLFANRKNLKPLSSFAASIGLDTDRFDACLAQPSGSTEVRNDMSSASRIGVSTTPSFVFALRDEANGTLKGMRFVRGALSFERFQTEIEQLLK